MIMGETLASIATDVIEGKSDEVLAVLAADRGTLGEAARLELQGRGHQVEYNDTNGVVVANVTLVDQVASEERTDSVNPVTADNPHQTTEYQAESVDETQPERAQHVDQTAAAEPAGEPAITQADIDMENASVSGPDEPSVTDAVKMHDPSTRDRGDMGPGA